MIRILNAEPQGYCEAARRVLERVGEVVERPVSRAELLRELGGCDVLIVRLGHQVDREVIDSAPRLLAIVTATTGLDHVDVAYAASRGVEVLSLSGETEFLRTVHATAEHTWALLLSLVRRIPQAFDAVRRGHWNRDRFRGRELSGKRLGLLGLGRLGQRVARYGAAFDMAVTAHDPSVDPWVGGVTRAASLPELLAGSDVLSIHVPLTPETRGRIGRRELAMLPAGAVLVNTSRGEIVDTDGLLWALETGHLAGAAVDVIPGERDAPDRARSDLLAYAKDKDNLLVTPHIGGATDESMARTELFMARKLVAFLETRRAVSAAGTG